VYVFAFVLFHFLRQFIRKEQPAMRSIVNGLLVLLLLAPVAAAQDKNQKAKPIDLSITAVGRQHHPIHTKSKEAQEFFDQGITLIYGFNHEGAARSFQRAAELDPASPMPLWGVALAVGPNYNSNVDAEREKLAFETIQKAQQLASASPQVEKDYVAALSTRYSGDANPDYKQLSRNYAAAMKALSAKYPDDLDAATMYAESLMDLNPWRLWSADGKPAENTQEIVIVLESVLERNPDHAGANHYYIHAVEASPNPARRCRARIAWTPWCRRRAIWCTCRRTFTNERAISTWQCATTQKPQKSTPPTRRKLDRWEACTT
jgi:hypothetical protein